MPTETRHIPNTITDARDTLTYNGEFATALEWERAAIVAAYVRLANQPGRPTAETVTVDRYSPEQFADLGIYGLRSKTTVRRYVERWLDANDGTYPNPGEDVTLPARPWDDQDARDARAEARAARQLAAATPEVPPAAPASVAARTVADDTDTDTDADADWEDWETDWDDIDGDDIDHDDTPAATPTEPAPTMAPPTRLDTYRPTTPVEDCGDDEDEDAYDRRQVAGSLYLAAGAIAKLGESVPFEEVPQAAALLMQFLDAWARGEPLPEWTDEMEDTARDLPRLDVDFGVIVKQTEKDKQQWAERRAERVERERLRACPCPRCKARPGEDCTNPKGKRLRDVHTYRRTMADLTRRQPPRTA